MTQDEILRMARGVWGERAILPFNELERFFSLAFTAGAAHERKECALIVEHKQVPLNWNDRECFAKAIRARGEK